MVLERDLVVLGVVPQTGGNVLHGTGVDQFAVGVTRVARDEHGDRAAFVRLVQSSRLLAARSGDEDEDAFGEPVETPHGH